MEPRKAARPFGEAVDWIAACALPNAGPHCVIFHFAVAVFEHSFEKPHGAKFVR
jgi:hypothetical protein